MTCKYTMCSMILVYHPLSWFSAVYSLIVEFCPKVGILYKLTVFPQREHIIQIFRKGLGPRYLKGDSPEWLRSTDATWWGPAAHHTFRMFIDRNTWEVLPKEHLKSGTPFLLQEIHLILPLSASQHLLFYAAVFFNMIYLLYYYQSTAKS